MKQLNKNNKMLKRMLILLAVLFVIVFILIKAEDFIKEQQASDKKQTNWGLSGDWNSSDDRWTKRTA